MDAPERRWLFFLPDGRGVAIDAKTEHGARVEFHRHKEFRNRRGRMPYGTQVMEVLKRSKEPLDSR